MALAGYRLISRGALAVIVPVMLVHGLWRRIVGRADRGALARQLAERLGRGSGLRPEGKVLWLHGASNGELTSVRWLVARLLAEVPGLSLIVTCNTPGARAMVQGWGLARVSVQLAPFDTPGPVARFLAQWQPDALVIVENELWPERIARTAAKVPVLLIGARISQRSARIWARMAPGLMRAMLARLGYVSAQDRASEARLLALGLPRDKLGPGMMLKSIAVPPLNNAPTPLGTFPPRARCLLAASTHEGEDAPILDAFAAARSAGAFDLLILAPRHPRRVAAIKALITARALPFALRSTGAAPGPDTAVYLADTLGEMDRWYAMAGATLIGGTWQNHGGHTPFEPVAQGSAILHGPHVANFTEAFATLDAAAAAICVEVGALAPALIALTAARQASLAQAAQAVLRPKGDASALIGAITRALKAAPMRKG